MLRRLFVQFSSVFGWQNMSTRIQMKRNAADDGTLQAYFECSELEIVQFFFYFIDSFMSYYGLTKPKRKTKNVLRKNEPNPDVLKYISHYLMNRCQFSSYLSDLILMILQQQFHFFFRLNVLLFSSLIHEIQMNFARCPF